MQDDNDNIFSFQKLKVWQKSILFAEKVIRTIDGLNTDRKHYRLIEQLESAATSVAMNISKGKGRQSTKEFTLMLHKQHGKNVIKARW